MYIDFRAVGCRMLKPDISVIGSISSIIFRRIRDGKLNIEDSLMSLDKNKFLIFSGQVFLVFSQEEDQSLCADFLEKFQRKFEEKSFTIIYEENLPEEVFYNEKPIHDLSISCIQKPLPAIPSKIEDTIFLGDKSHASLLELLSSLCITHIINVTKDIPCYFLNDFEYLRINIDDLLTENIIPHLLEVIKFISTSIKVNPDAKFLFHCAAGISRSPAIVIGYIMWRDKKSFYDTFLQVQEQRYCIDPNFAFCTQLIMGQSRIHAFEF